MLLHKLRLVFASLFLQARLMTVIAAVFLYAASSYLMLYLTGEKALLEPTEFVYWLVVTASTVGYGDLSPSSEAARWVVSVWVIPVGLSLFALVLTRVGIVVSELVQQGKKGLRMLDLKDHIVIIGWNQARTLRLIELMKAKANATHTKMVLCVTEDIDNPVPGEIDFVHVDAYSHEASMSRASLKTASRIVIDTPQDDVTLTTALFCQKVSPDSHKTAYFEDETVGRLLKDHCPNIECIPSLGTELLAKASLDPGSSQLHRQLLDGTDGMTQYAIEYQGTEVLSYGAVFDHFKHTLTATVIGMRVPSGDRILVNPDMEARVEKGSTLYYINERRLTEQESFGPLLTH